MEHLTGKADREDAIHSRLDVPLSQDCRSMCAVCREVADMKFMQARKNQNCSLRSTPSQSTDLLPSFRKGVIMVGYTPSGTIFLSAMLAVTERCLQLDLRVLRRGELLCKMERNLVGQ